MLIGGSSLQQQLLWFSDNFLLPSLLPKFCKESSFPPPPLLIYSVTIHTNWSELLHISHLRSYNAVLQLVFLLLKLSQCWLLGSFPPWLFWSTPCLASGTAWASRLMLTWFCLSFGVSLFYKELHFLLRGNGIWTPQFGLLLGGSYLGPLRRQN